MTVYLTRGIPGSGKTTWAKRQGIPRVNRDDIRDMIGRDSFADREIFEGLVTQIETESVKALAKKGNVIVDEYNGVSDRLDDYHRELILLRLESRKDQAFWISENVDSDYRGLLFWVLDGKKPGEKIWDLVKPKWEGVNV